MRERKSRIDFKVPTIRGGLLIHGFHDFGRSFVPLDFIPLSFFSYGPVLIHIFIQIAVDIESEACTLIGITLYFYVFKPLVITFKKLRRFNGVLSKRFSDLIKCT